MTQLLIVAHQPLASALDAVAHHVYPDCARRLRSVDIEPQWSLEEATARVRDALAQARPTGDPAAEVLVLVDTQGATPGKAARLAATGAGVRVLSGVNVPMLWRTLCYAEEPLQALAQRAVEGGARGVAEYPVEPSAGR